MAKNRPTESLCSMTTIISASIAAGFLVYSLLSIFTPATDQPDEVVANESEVQFFLRCLRLQRLYNLPDEEFDSHRDKGEAIICHDIFRLLQFTYEDTGRLPSGYKEALLIGYNNNQIFADIHICGLDSRRCSNQTLELMSRYHDEPLCGLLEEC